MGPLASQGALGARSVHCALLPVCICMASLARFMWAVAGPCTMPVRRARIPRAGRVAKFGFIHGAEPARGVGDPCSLLQVRGSGVGAGVAGLILITRHHRGPPPPLCRRLGQIFFQAFGQSKFSLAPSAPMSGGQTFSSAPLKTQHHWVEGVQGLDQTPTPPTTPLKGAGGGGGGLLQRGAIEGGCQSGCGWLLLVTNAIEASTCRQGDSGWA